MEQMQTIESYAQLKDELTTQLEQTAEGFVRIGYLLRKARDTDILKESPYNNVNDFAKAEFGIDNTMVSKWIHINERFSEGGYSDRLKETYKGFGYAKLAIMLQLPETVTEELSPAFSKADIQILQNETKEEAAVTDIERMIETIPEVIERSEDTLTQTIIALCESHAGIYDRLHSLQFDVKEYKNVLIPNAEAFYSVRVPGKGRMFLSLKDVGECTVTNVRTNEKDIVSWEDIVEVFKTVIHPEKTAKEDYEEQFKKVYPENKEIAPVQTKKSKVEVVEQRPEKPGEEKPESHKVKTEIVEKRPEAAEVKNQEEHENVAPEEVQDEKKESMTENQIRGFKVSVRNSITRMAKALDEDDWEKVKNIAGDIVARAGWVIRQ